MLLGYNTEKKLLSLIVRIDKLLLSDFPHKDSKSALNLLKVFFERHLARLAKAEKSAKPDTIVNVCITINERIYEYLPLLGFILRSTNIRNDFEWFYAILELSKRLIGQNAKVIISSEWDYSPLTFPLTISVLPNFVFLGLPSSESSNALILPLAGHELGHSIWQNEGLEELISPDIDSAVKAELLKQWQEFLIRYPEFDDLEPDLVSIEGDLFIVEIISDIVKLAVTQCEEIFCDACGVRLFGQGYIHAFHYLLAPSFGGYRSLEYPMLPVRARILSDFSGINLKEMGFQSYEDEFTDKNPSLFPRDDFKSRIADKIAEDMAQEMFKYAQEAIADRAPAPNVKAQETILKMFRAGIPSNQPTSLADVINAGWSYVVAQRGEWNERDRPLFEWVSELVFKSIEVLEYQQKSALNA